MGTKRKRQEIARRIEEGEFRPYIYHLFYPITLRDGRQAAKPFATVCLLPTADPTPSYARGVAICSERDQFRYDRGRDLALKRAVIALAIEGKALECKADRAPSCQRAYEKFYWLALPWVAESTDSMRRLSCAPGFKADYPATLTETEQRMLSKKSNIV